MPSATCTLSTPHHTFRGSYSSATTSPTGSPEPLTVNCLPPTPGCSSASRPARTTFGRRVQFLRRQGPATKTQPPSLQMNRNPGKATSQKDQEGFENEGVIYECNICGARYKKGTTMRPIKYYCSELQMAKPVTVGTHVSSEAEKSQAESMSPGPQMMHYKLGTTLETPPLRKRRKEKSGMRRRSHWL